MGPPGLVFEKRPFLIISAPSTLAYNQTSVSDGGCIVLIDNHSLDRCSLMFATPYWFARIARVGTSPAAFVSGASTLLPGRKTNPVPLLSHWGGSSYQRRVRAGDSRGAKKGLGHGREAGSRSPVSGSRRRRQQASARAVSALHTGCSH